MTPISAWQQIQRAVGTRPDGIPGLATARAVAEKLGLTLSEDAPQHRDPSPDQQQWPHDDTESLTAFYGNPCDESRHTLIFPPYQLYMDGTPLKQIRVHEKIAQPVMRALQKVLDHYGPDQIAKLKLNVFDGCFNCRPIRGGTRPSVHSFAAALDFLAAENDLHQDHTTATFARPEYAAWFDIWESEGATSLGRSRDFDWMHVQFASL